MPEYKDCSFCGKKVLKEALKCKYCFAMLQDVPRHNIIYSFPYYISE